MMNHARSPTFLDSEWKRERLLTLAWTIYSKARVFTTLRAPQINSLEVRVSFLVRSPASQRILPSMNGNDFV
jgi:hypothetical protein